jgi:hypothetical protein
MKSERQCLQNTPYGIFDTCAVEGCGFIGTQALEIYVDPGRNSDPDEYDRRVGALCLLRSKDSQDM